MNILVLPRSCANTPCLNYYAGMSEDEIEADAPATTWNRPSWPLAPVLLVGGCAA